MFETPLLFLAHLPNDFCALFRSSAGNLVFQQLELRAGEAFGKGTQVWLTYDKRNDDLLLNYGYVSRGLPWG